MNLPFHIPRPDRNQPEPLWHQTERALRALIADGTWSDGAQLPNEAKLGGNECFDMAAPAIPIAEKAVVHEQPFSAGEWMAICARNCSARCGADVGEKQVRLQMAAQVAQILIRPSRPDLAIQARFGMLAVPAEPESIAIDAGGRFHRVNALRNQGMSGLGDVIFERRRFTAIRDPAAHGEAFLLSLKDYASNVASRIHRVTLYKAMSSPWCSCSAKIRNWASAEVPSNMIARHCSACSRQARISASVAVRSRI